MKIRKFFFSISLFLAACLQAHAQTESFESFNRSDSLHIAEAQTGGNRKNFIQRFIDEFNALDTNYVLPNKYNWAFLLQNTNTFESYTIRVPDSKQSISFSPTPSIRIGPYLGWRWLFFGYTFDVTSLGKNHTSTKTEFELSLYSSMLTCDLIYRRTGDDFRIRQMNGFEENTEGFEGKLFNGIKTSTIGLNAYYVFNHRKFSYPAAYAQSTIQKRSCGTWKLGFAFDMHELSFDYQKLPTDIPVSNNLKFKENKYWNFSISAGYGYNWVFRKNCLLNISLTPAIGYTRNLGQTQFTQEDENINVLFKNFNRNNIHLNFTGRMGIVWNNSKYFTGMSLIVHTYNFRHTSLFTSNTFGTLNFYVGLNFIKRKAYRNE